MDIHKVGGLNDTGFAFMHAVYPIDVLEAMATAVGKINWMEAGVMRSSETYAIRQVMRHAPSLSRLVWNDRMRSLVRDLVGDNAFVSKSIWFDKSPGGNWFVGHHQDISICVARKVETEGYSRWTSKHGMIGVVPPVGILDRTLTIRIHLDRADTMNGALKVKPGSHRHGILRNTMDGMSEEECPMEAGDVMLMRPLLLHASMRSSGDAPRRVLHLEVTNVLLDGALEWGEKWMIDP